MDDITKKMVNQLSESFYSTKMLVEQDEEATTNTNDSNAGLKVYPTSDDRVIGYVQDINKQVNSVHISFDSLKYNPQQKKAHWSGTIAGVEWTAVYTDKLAGFYFTANNEEMTKEQSLAFHKLNVYFQTVWFSAIRDAILKNELDN